ncbi:hypothetical protein ACLQ2Q_17675 [Microbacterium sp. DT81.1]|uniref:hypothetical protein n=1 Tax=Microbacterium sp. DT81.1 TaxID=3393413 RepID=UPI003CF4395A
MSQAAASGLTFDARPLVEPIDRRAARDYAKRLRQSGAVSSFYGTGTGIAALVFGVVIVVVFGSVFLTFISSIINLAGSSTGGGFGIVTLVPFLVIAAVLVFLITLAVRGSLGSQERWYRLNRFAEANGMQYVPNLAGPRLPGMIFGVGSARAASDLLRGEEPRFVEFGNYRYTTGSGKNRTTHTWGYVAIKLDVPLPNIVLDAVGNNGLFGASNLTAAFDRDQRLSLEGDFDTYFSLYCPEGYERDALYLFTPDIMARFVDSAAALDVEIVDDWLFLYAERDLSTLDPAMWAWLFSCVQALLAKFDQWARWRDERLEPTAQAFAPGSGPLSVATDAAASTPPMMLRPPPGVAEPGRRLKRTVPWWSYVIAGIFVAFWLLMQVLPDLLP